jgi:glycosyltransferase involved in cell wall biosynthesis
VFVYDNNSTDETARRAAAAEAIVRNERRQGKGHVVRRMFTDVEADVYVLVDGDDTYDAMRAPEMVALQAMERLDMVIGRRVHQSKDAYRPGHVFGNELLTRAVGWVFRHELTDILSGYRVFSRRFVKSFPVFAGGFEIETELTIHALTLGLPVREIDTAYKERPTGSASKLRTYRDGLRVLGKILAMFRSERPLAFFSAAGAILIAAALALIYPVVTTFLETGQVPRFPTAILATGMTLAGLISMVCGLVLDAVTLGRREAKLLAYLGVPPAAGAAQNGPPPLSRTASLTPGR